MRSPRRLWFGYLIAGLAMLVVVGGLSGVALRLESQAEHARRKQERLNRVRIALWRLDSHLTPILGRLAAHAYSHYVPAYAPPQLYSANGRRQTERVLLEPSPILMNDWPAWVVLHFQAPIRGSVSSPQVPRGRFRWVGSVAGLPATPLRREQLQGLARWLRPDVREHLAQAVQFATWNPGGGVAVAQAPPTSSVTQPAMQQGQQRAQQRMPQRPQQRAQQQRLRTERSRRAGNYDNNQFQFIPRQNPDTVGNVQLNTGGKLPHQGSGPAASKRVFVPLSQVRATWIEAGKGGQRLILYRVAKAGGQQYLQGALVDWPGLREQLVELVADLFPGVSLRRSRGAGDLQEELQMTTLPVVLGLPSLAGLVRPWYHLTPMRVGLLFAWILTLAALFAAAIMVRRMIELGERRMNFVNAVSHELRTPLTAFRMHLDMLADGLVTDPERRQSMLVKLQGQSERLTELVRNVLDYARLERKTFVAERQAVLVAVLFDELVEACEPRCLETGLTLDVERNVPDTAAVNTDPSAVRQIVVNLVDNACKYGAAAADRRIHLTAKLERGVVAIAVTDHGPGIPAQASRRLFDPFYRAGREMTRDQPGVGLGLALARRFAHTLGAELTLDGPLRQDGTHQAVFTLRLKQAPK